MNWVSDLAIVVGLVLIVAAVCWLADWFRRRHVVDLHSPERTDWADLVDYPVVPTPTRENWAERIAGIVTQPPTQPPVVPDWTHRDDCRVDPLAFGDCGCVSDPAMAMVGYGTAGARVHRACAADRQSACTYCADVMGGKVGAP